MLARAGQTGARGIEQPIGCLVHGLQRPIRGFGPRAGRMREDDVFVALVVGTLSPGSRIVKGIHPSCNQSQAAS
jgi:hypothetical protein